MEDGRSRLHPAQRYASKQRLGAHVKNVIAHDIVLRPNTRDKPSGILAGEAESTVF